MDSALPYRPNVGVALFNRAGLVLIAKRIEDDGPEVIGAGYEWQMPQGGVDEGEDLEAAVRRELHEETAVRSVEILGATEDWLTYDFPPYSGPPHKLAAFRGQRQRWYAMRFVGDEGEIDVTRSVEGVPAEFSEWRWERLAAAAELVVPFKRAIYAELVRAFARFAT